MRLLSESANDCRYSWIDWPMISMLYLRITWYWPYRIWTGLAGCHREHRARKKLPVFVDGTLLDWSPHSIPWATVRSRLPFRRLSEWYVTHIPAIGLPHDLAESLGAAALRPLGCHLRDALCVVDPLAILAGQKIPYQLACEIIAD